MIENNSTGKKFLNIAIYIILYSIRLWRRWQQQRQYNRLENFFLHQLIAVSIVGVEFSEINCFWFEEFLKYIRIFLLVWNCTMICAVDWFRQVKWKPAVEREREEREKKECEKVKNAEIIMDFFLFDIHFRFIFTQSIVSGWQMGVCVGVCVFSQNLIWQTYHIFK